MKTDFKSRFNLRDKNLAKIFTFFVIETPVSNVSFRCVSFKERNISMIRLTGSIKHEITDLKHNWIACKKQEVESKHEQVNSHLKDNSMSEYAVHTKSRDSKTESLYYAIRCAFAHGSFDIVKRRNNKYYYLENRDKGIIKAKILLKEESLLKLIELVEN